MTGETTNLFDLTRERMEAFTAPVDDKPYRTHQIMKWAYHQRQLDFSGMTNLSKAFRDWLTEHAVYRLPEVVTRRESVDGTVKWVVRVGNGNCVETVLIPERGRNTLCVSSQVGCAVGCVFCMTGREGLKQQVSSAEIVAQIALARQQHTVRRVVFMGMGEPAHNLDNVMNAIELLGSVGDIGHKNLVFSTVGDARVFERLPRGPVKPALALSLHSTDAERRAKLLPRAPRFDPAELVELGERYARATGYPMQVQWTLLAGVNDGDDELDGIVALLRGKHAILNMIPYNHVDGLGHRRPDAARCTAIFRQLNQRGVLTRMRQSAGQEVDGGCGQLRARVIALHPA